MPDNSPEKPRSLEDQRNEILAILDKMLSTFKIFLYVEKCGLKDQTRIQLQTLRTEPFTAVVTKIINLLWPEENTNSTEYLNALRALQDEVLAIDIKKDTASKQSTLTENPVVGELVDAVTFEINRRVANTVDEYLRLKGIGGKEIQTRLAEAEALKARVVELEKLDEERLALKKRAEGFDAELQRKDEAIAQLFREMDQLLAAADVLRRERGSSGTPTLTDTERTFLELLSGPASLLGMTSDEIMLLRRGNPIEEDFKRLLKRRSTTALHPDKVHVLLTACPDTSLKDFITKIATRRFQLIDTALEEIFEQFKQTGKLENRWKYRRVK